MPPAGIVGLGSFVPPGVMTNDDWAGLVESSDEWITTKTGIKERRIADPETCTSDLAARACEQALEEAGMKPGDIDMLILATSSPDVPLSSTAGITQHKLGCDKAAAFDINAVCAGWVHALDVGSRFVGTPGYDNVLVVGAERQRGGHQRAVERALHARLLRRLRRGWRGEGRQQRGRSWSAAAKCASASS